MDGQDDDEGAVTSAPPEMPLVPWAVARVALLLVPQTVLKVLVKNVASLLYIGALTESDRRHT